MKLRAMTSKDATEIGKIYRANYPDTGFKKFGFKILTEFGNQEARLMALKIQKTTSQ